jgi:uncharacterized membrane protein
MRNVVSTIMLIPTTIASLALSFLFLLVASVGGSMLVVFAVLTVVWAGTISMWCILLRALDEKQAGSSLPLAKRWWYYLVLCACMALLVFAIKDPVSGIMSWAAFGWLALTLVNFFAIVYQSARPVAGVSTQAEAN